ncbi:hypothetical protein TNCV_2742351 [Trichonephila clavipes]|nr:hypothetical protein TNCV_2742351 [Trichonephila clavipes]
MSCRLRVDGMTVMEFRILKAPCQMDNVLVHTAKCNNSRFNVHEDEVINSSLTWCPQSPNLNNNEFLEEYLE